MSVSRPLLSDFGGPWRTSEALFSGLRVRGERCFGNLRFFEDVLNEITTFDAFGGLSREAKCDPCASLAHVRMLLHMQTAMGRLIRAKSVDFGVPRSSLERHPLAFAEVFLLVGVLGRTCWG